MKVALRFASACLLWSPVLTLHAGQIQGQTQGSTVTGFAIDDLNTATTLDATYTTFSSGVFSSMLAKGFDISTFVFAGMGAAANIPNVPASDFNIEIYHPWVVYNNPTTNNMIAPDGSNLNRGVTGQDAGGADFLMTYTPTLPTDPTTINFIQVFQEDDNEAGFGPPILDNFFSTTDPYYNQGGHAAGTGSLRGISPLPIAPGGNAWFADIPYACENGTALQRKNAPNCSGGTDDTIFSQERIFDVFVVAPTIINGTTYNVIVGGVDWGYSYDNVDGPEPATVVLFVTALLGLVSFRGRILA
jgi:hypothetical protein